MEIAGGCCEGTESTAYVHVIPVVLRVDCEEAEKRDCNGSEAAVMVPWHRG